MSEFILIVDDDTENSFILSKVLEQNEYSVQTVKSSKECRQAIKEKLPDIAIIDVLLGTESGIELCRDIKEKNPLIPVILISGKKISPEERVFGLESGADDYLCKPIKNKELLARISVVLRWKKITITKRNTEAYSIFNQSGTVHTSRTFGQQPIREFNRPKFDELCRNYQKVLEHAIEERIYKLDTSHDDDLKLFARELAALSAGARDIIELHRAVLLQMEPCKNAKKAYYFKEESRIMLVELLGTLLNIYRHYS